MSRKWIAAWVVLGLLAPGTSIAGFSQDDAKRAPSLPSLRIDSFSSSLRLTVPQHRFAFDLPRPGATAASGNDGEKTAYGKILLQSLMFLGVEHGVRLAQEKKTRQELKGPFFHDWFAAVSTLSGWSDEGSVFSNWICHPAQGSTAAFIFAQNNPQSRRARFGANREYVHAKAKQLLFSFIYSVQFEIGPISECSLGNLGQKHGDAPWQQRGKQAYVDQVVTPVLGTAWSIGEDAVNQKFLRPFSENHRYLGKVLRVVLNPTFSLANLFAFHAPWYRH